MKLPAQEFKANDTERKRRRRTGPTININNNNGNGCDVINGDCSDVEMQKRERVANFPHHKRVADYLLGKSVGEGSFAKVRLGLHVQTAEEVAVKVMSKARARKDSYVHKNLRREGRILQMARHRNIVQVYDILETDNNYYLVTEFCKGGELIDIVTEKGCLPEHDVRKYMTQLVSAVSHLHDHGIVHRDLKVENLLLNDAGELKIIDFGLSNVISPKCGDPTRALATQCGSPAYAAPELLAKNMYGPKVDVWSIGVITYALLVGKLPFTVEPFRIPKLCRKMLLGDMNPIPSNLSGNCRHFIRRLLIPDPEIRPTIAQVIKMTWIASSSRNTKSPYVKTAMKNDDIHASSDINTEVVREMTSKLDFEFADVLNCVRKNRPGEALATYYLLLKQKLHHRDVMERRKTDVIGSDGNLDHANESDAKSSDEEEEEGLNDVDDVTDDVIINEIFRKDVLYKQPNKAAEKKQKTAYCNDTIVDDIIERHTNGVIRTPSGRKSSARQSKQRLNQTAHNGIRESDDTSTQITNGGGSSTELENGERDILNGEITSPGLKNEEENIPSDSSKKVNDSKKEPKKAGGSSSKFPELKTSSGGQSASKPERKSRGPSSMRDLVKTMSRARQALQRRSVFGQNKNARAEDKKQNCSPEMGRFTRLLSRNSDDAGEPSPTKRQVSDTTNSTTRKWGSKSPQFSRNLWKNHLTPGEASTLTPSPRVSLPEAPPPTNPMSLRLSSNRQWRDGRTVLPSNGYIPKYSNGLHSPLVGHYERTSTPHRLTSFRNRKNTTDAGSDTPDVTNHILPRISVDRSTNQSDVLSNPLGNSNLTPRYHFPSPPRTPLSRENTGMSNGVKEMIDKFHSLLNEGPSPGSTPTTQSKFDRGNDSTVAAMAYLSSNRKKREEIKNRTPSRTNVQFLTHAMQTKPRSPSPYGTYRLPSASPGDGYVSPHKERTFVSHFARDADVKAFENDVIHSYLPKTHKDATTPDFKSPSPAVWYKSAV